ncbi:MAG: LPS assembly lipoprotein LptE [Fidelibacterota bacterium]
MSGFESASGEMGRSKVITHWLRTVGIILPFFLTGCAFYSFTGSIPPHIRTISIPLFLNETAEFGIAEAVTDEVTNVFIEENVLKVVEERDSDSVLRGTIRSISDRPFTYSETEEVTEYRFSVSIEVEWYDIDEEKDLLRKDYSGWGSYSLSEDISSDGKDNDGDGKIDAEDPDETGDPRALAARVAVGKIASDIINDIVSTW